MPDTDSERAEGSADREGEFTFRYDTRVENGELVFSVEGFDVFRATFYPDNYATFFFELLKPTEQYLTITEDQRRRLYAGVREAAAKEGKEISDEELSRLEPEALHELALRLHMRSVKAATERVRENLPSIIAMIFRRVVYATFFARANELRNMLEIPEQKFSAKEIRDTIFQPDWEQIKNIAGATSGGARNVKHTWTDGQRACLASKYEQLKPIWSEAKRIAVAAQKSREATRSRRWQEQVKAAYPDLPDDLIELLSAPKSAEAKPADIALTHAARQCIPVSYSLRWLRRELKAWKVKSSI